MHDPVATKLLGQDPARQRVVGPDGIVSDDGELLTYETDGLTKLRSKPAVTVLPTSADQVQGIVRQCHTAGVPFVARGQGTGLSGGAMPHPDGVLIVMTRMNRILDIDLPNQRITVEPGVMNLDVTKAVAPEGYYYAPDPSSQVICSIGGNLAENSGGAHCLKYGFTVPNRGHLATPEALVGLARRGEELGFDSIQTGDHIVVPNRIVNLVIAG